MVAKIGKFCDYIVGRAQGTRIGEKHIESNTNHIFLLCFAYKQCKTQVFALVVGISDETSGAGEVGVGYKIAFLFGSHCDLSVQGSVNGRWSQSNGSFLPVFIWRC